VTDSDRKHPVNVALNMVIHRGLRRKEATYTHIEWDLPATSSLITMQTYGVQIFAVKTNCS